MARGRKSANVAAVGGVMPRQRVYDVLREYARAQRFVSLWVIATDAQVDEAVVQTYVRALHLAGLVVEREEVARARCTSDGRTYQPGIGQECAYRLVRDLGVEAPRLTREGLALAGLTTQEAIWRAVRVLRRFSWVDVHAAVSPDDAPTAPATVKAYLADLHAAGYTKKVMTEKPGTPALWALRPDRDTGPRAPMVQRSKVVFDPNEGRAVFRWSDTEESIEPSAKGPASLSQESR